MSCDKEKELPEAAKAFEERILEIVQVTLKIPKPLHEFCKAVKEFTKAEATVEEIFSDQLTAHMIGVLSSNHLDEVFPELERERLFKAYKLDEIDC